MDELAVEVYRGCSSRSWHWRIVNAEGVIVATDPRPAVNAKMAQTRYEVFRDRMRFSYDIPIRVKT